MSVCAPLLQLPGVLLLAEPLLAPGTEVLLLACITALACALPGAFLVLRRMSLVSDAISHSILFGIVIGFFIARELSSPLLILGAALTGVLTVSMIELIGATRRVREDAAIGLVFPVLFSIGVILITRYAGNIHLDVDAVLVGELAYAPLDRVDVAGLSLPRGFIVMGLILLANVTFVALFYKELTLSTFDSQLAAALGFRPALIHYAFVALVSVTVVGAFDAVGSILVVALMVAPPAAALLLTERLARMLWFSAIGGVAAAALGYLLAVRIDSSISGSMALAAGGLFTLALLFGPRGGIVARAIAQRRQRRDFASQMLAVHLLQHEGTAQEAFESTVRHMHEHLRWNEAFAGRVMLHAVQSGILTRSGERLKLTAKGREVAREALLRT